MALIKKLMDLFKGETIEISQKTEASVKPTAKNVPDAVAKKDRSERKMVVEKTSLKLPKQILNFYSEARVAGKSKNFDASLGAYKKTLKYALEEFCVLTGLSSKGKSKRQLMIQVCDQLNISWDQNQKFRELGCLVDGYREYGKMSNEERCLHIQNTMETFLELLAKALENNEDSNTPVVKEKAARRAAANKAAHEENEKKQRELLSFKARETLIKGIPFNIDKEHPKVKMYLDNAEKNYQVVNYSGALNEIRKALEVMVKALCRKLSVTYGDKEELVSMINKLDATGKLSKGQKKVLNDAKWFGNLGSHDYDKIEVTESDVTKGFAEIKKVKLMFTTFMTDERSLRNAPVVGTNEYYSPQRKYYGRWSDCFSYASLMMIDDYVMLKERAEEGDIQAMLDIASGFLESSICWTESSLIYLKKYKDPLYHPDPCDARYYCWILLACQTAYNDWKAGKPLPLRYLANALLEGIKFIYMHRTYKANLTSRQIVNCHSDQFAQAVELFGFNSSYDSWQDRFIEMLTAMMEEYHGDNLFAVVHKEKSVQDIEKWRISKKVK